VKDDTLASNTRHDGNVGIGRECLDCCKRDTPHLSFVKIDAHQFSLMIKGALYWITSKDYGHTVGTYTGETGKFRNYIMSTSQIQSHHCTYCCIDMDWCICDKPSEPEKFYAHIPTLTFIQLPISKSVRTKWKSGQRVLVVWIHIWSKCVIGVIHRRLDDGRYSIDVDGKSAHHIVERHLMWPENALELRANCKRAVIYWLLAFKKKVHKDIILLIAQWIWLTRDEEEWASHKHSRPPRSTHKKIKKYAE